MITGINESKTLPKHISRECKCRFDESRCECKKHNVCEKDYVWSLARCNCENGKHLASIMDNSAIMCDEVIDAEAEEESSNEETKTFPTNFNEKKYTAKLKIYIFYLHFY